MPIEAKMMNPMLLMPSSTPAVAKQHIEIRKAT